MSFTRWPSCLVRLFKYGSSLSKWDGFLRSGTSRTRTRFTYLLLECYSCISELPTTVIQISHLRPDITFSTHRAMQDCYESVFSHDRQPNSQCSALEQPLLVALSACSQHPCNNHNNADHYFRTEHGDKNSHMVCGRDEAANRYCSDSLQTSCPLILASSSLSPDDTVALPCLAS